jgi:hypothetical protein
VFKQRLPAIKKQRAKQKSEAIRQGLLQQKHDKEKGETCGTGIALKEQVTIGRKMKAKRISNGNMKSNEKSACWPTLQRHIPQAKIICWLSIQ